MEEKTIRPEQLRAFARQLAREEKSAATIEKYLRDVRALRGFAAGRPVSKELAVAYKRALVDAGYAARSINSMLASVNRFFGFLGWTDCKVKGLRLQRQAYCAEDRELTREEYARLVEAAGEQTQLRLLLQTICATGIRVSELRYFTVEAVRRGEVTIHCKGKTRTVLIPSKLRRLLLAYAARSAIASGAIFVTRSGRPLDRSNIWARMKKLCARANVQPSKVFPHNLRKLFARTFYGLEKDIAKLADVLGHSSIETTRIYIMTTGTEHRRKIERLHLLI